MRIIFQTGRPDLAEIYVAQLREGPEHRVEFVDSCGDRGGDRRNKWVIIVSSQFGCPVGCRMCDAGRHYHGNLSPEEIIWQVRTAVAIRNIDPAVCSKFKVQFARMGEPALNDAVLTTMDWLAVKYPNCMPCISTLAPAGREEWFERLVRIRGQFRDFQLQFSLHSTDRALTDELMPIEKMDWRWLAQYGRAFHRPGLRKPSLNFAISHSLPLDPEAVAQAFDPDIFAIKLTPLNPTRNTAENELATLDGGVKDGDLLWLRAREFERLGFEVIVSIGDWEENLLGSNCGQLVADLKSYGNQPLSTSQLLA